MGCSLSRSCSSCLQRSILCCHMQPLLLQAAIRTRLQAKLQLYGPGSIHHSKQIDGETSCTGLAAPAATSVPDILKAAPDQPPLAVAVPAHSHADPQPMFCQTGTAAAQAISSTLPSVDAHPGSFRPPQALARARPDQPGLPQAHRAVFPAHSLGPLPAPGAAGTGSSAGFSTASGKPVSISEQAQHRARAVLGDEMAHIMGQQAGVAPAWAVHEASALAVGASSTAAQTASAGSAAAVTPAQQLHPARQTDKQVRVCTAGTGTMSPTMM